MNLAKLENVKSVLTGTNSPFFDSLFHTYYGPLLAFAQTYVLDRQAAEDVVQDVYMEVWVKKDLIDFSLPIKPYLYKSVHNKSLNYLKNKAFTESLESMPFDLLIREEMLSYESMNTVLVDEIANEIKTCIEHLPAQCRNVFILSREENLKNREIAERLAISEKAVEKHISKALCLLRSHLKATKLIHLIPPLILYRFFT